MPERDIDTVTDEVDEKRDPAEIQASIRTRRRDLVESVSELEAIVRAKLDIKGRMRRLAERGLRRATLMIESATQRVRERPVPYLVVGGAILVLLFGRRVRRYSY